LVVRQDYSHGSISILILLIYWYLHQSAILVPILY
jgi:hypothetical protein